MDHKMSEQKLNINFVKEVEKYPCIYDYRRLDYSRKDVIDKAWATIGKKINLTGPQCRERWKNLRTVLSRNLRPKESNGTSRSSKQQRKPYYLFEAMKFAVPFIKSHNTVPAYFRPSDSLNSPSDYDVRADDHEADEENVKEDICHIKVEVSEDTQSRSPSPQYSSPPMSPQVNILEAPSPTTSDHSLHTEPTGNVRKRMKSNDMVEIDESVSQNFKKKKSNNNGNKMKPELTKLSKKRFLLSLLSDLYSMDDTQMRTFRMRVLNLINEISQTSSIAETLCSVCQGNGGASSRGQSNLFQIQQSSELSGLVKDLLIEQNTFSPVVAVKVEKHE